VPNSCHTLVCHGLFLPLNSYHPSVSGKKDAEMDRNFDTLDLPKRTEAAKGEWIKRQSWGAWPGVKTLCHE
jgi:hypothetical protein